MKFFSAIAVMLYASLPRTTYCQASASSSASSSATFNGANSPASATSSSGGSEYVLIQAQLEQILRESTLGAVPKDT